VAVEGVETKEQLALIQREPSIDEIQGFLVGAAVPEREIREILFSSPVCLGKVA
jgi:EAL domain-containing protein (putative c-di-GMP-specific phosphodiesterase class I)